MPGFAELAPTVPRVMGIPARVSLVLTILLAMLVGMAKSSESGDEATRVGESIGMMLVLCGFPALVAFLIAGRKKVRHPNRFVLIFCSIAGFFILANAASLLVEEPAEARFTRLLREAAGLQPVSHRGMPRQRRFDDAVRFQYGELLKKNREYMEKMKKLNTETKTKTINSAESFGSPEIAQAALQHLHLTYQAEAAHEQETGEVMGGLRRVMENNAAPADRETILAAFDESLAKQFGVRAHLLAVEKDWIDAVDDEYAYVDAHRKSIRVASGKVVINDLVVREQFNAKLLFQRQKRLGFLKTKTDFDKLQTEALTKMGVTGKDMGVK